jgi:transcriptional regulator with XRE-family HTH domain
MLKNLRYLREKRGLSQAQFARAIGISQQSVCKYENQTTVPGVEMLTQIADFFDTSIDFLVGNTDIERRYETVYEYDLNDNEMQMMEKYREFDKDGQNALLSLLDVFVNE